MRERDDAVTGLLKRARRRITDPNHWTLGTYARDAGGRVALPASPAAVQWCALGALQAEAPRGWHLGGKRHAEFSDALHRLAEAIPERGWMTPASVPDLNDEGDHAAVLKLYDAAIRGK